MTWTTARNSLVGLAGLAMAAPGANAVVIVNDGFEVLTHPTEDRTVAAGAGVPFYARFAPATNAAIVDDAVFGSKALNFVDTDGGTTNNYSVVGRLAAPLTIANVGESITLSFKARYTDVATAGNNGNNFRFGLFSSNGTPVTGDGQSAIDNDQGYYAATGSGTANPATNSTLFNESGGVASILGGTDRASFTIVGPPAAINDNNVHTFSLTLTRSGTGTVDLALVVDGGAAITATSSGPSLRTTFDEVAFGTGFTTATVSISIDDVSVEFVPEPGALGVLGLAAGVLGVGRRRR